MQENILEKLEKFKPLNKQENLQDFIILFEEVVRGNNPDCIPFLLSFLEDESEYFDVMQFIVTELEEFPPELYIPKFLESVSALLPSAAQWLITIFIRMLNNAECYLIIKKNITFFPGEQIIKFLKLVSKESPKHQLLCNELEMLIESEH